MGNIKGQSSIKSKYNYNSVYKIRSDSQKNQS